MADQQPVPMTFRLGYQPQTVDQGYADKQKAKDEEAYQRFLMQERAERAAEQGPTTPEAPAKPAEPAAPAEPEKPAWQVGLETGAMASADAVRNMADGLRAVFGGGPSPAVAKALNVPEVPEGQGPKNQLEAAKHIVLSGLFQFGFSPLAGTFAGARQALANSYPEAEQTTLASGMAAAGIRGLLEGKSYASLSSAEQARYLSPFTLGEAIETIGPMLAPQLAMKGAPLAKKGAKAVAGRVKEVAPVLMSERGSVGAAPGPAGAAGEPPPPGGAAGPPTPEIRVNLERISADQAVKDVVAELNRRQAGALAEHRKVKGHAETVRESKEALTLEKALALSMDAEEVVLSAPEQTALRDLYNAAAKHLEELRRAADAGDQAAADQAFAAMTVAGRLALLDEAVARNLARGLEARKILSEAQRAETFNPHDIAVMAQTLERVTDMDGGAFLKRLALLRTATQKKTFLRQLWQVGRLTRDVAHSIWTHNLLTNPVTHVANVGSTALATAWEIPERYTAEIIHRVFSDSPDGVQKGETFALMRGMTKGIYTDGLRFARKAALGEDPFLGKGHVERGPRINAESYGWDPKTTTGRVVDVLGSTMDNLPAFAALRIEDAYLKGVNFQGELYALSVREARARGFTGKRLAQEIATLEKTPTAPMIEAAADSAMLRTLNAELGPAGQFFMRWANAIPGGRLILPFIKTPTNSMKWWGQRLPVLNMLSVQNWHDVNLGGPTSAARERAIARMALGSLAGAVIAWQVFEGNITGAGEQDKNLRRDARAAGVQSFSIRVGDSWYNYNRLDPIGAYIGVVASAAELMAQVPQEDWADHLADALIVAGGQTMTNKSYMTGLSNVLEAITDPNKRAHAVASGFARSIVPAGIRQIERSYNEGVIRDTQTLLDEIKAGVPGWSDSVPPLLNPITGEPIRMPPGWGIDMISPVLVSKMDNDPVLLEVIRNGVSVPMWPRYVTKGEGAAVLPSILGPKRTVEEGAPIELTPLEYYEWARLTTQEIHDGSGRTLHERLTQMVQSPEYQQLSPGLGGSQHDRIQDIVRTYRRLAFQELLRKDPELKRDLDDAATRKIEKKLPVSNPRARPAPRPVTPATQRLLNLELTPSAGGGGSGGAQLPATLER